MYCGCQRFAEACDSGHIILTSNDGYAITDGKTYWAIRCCPFCGYHPSFASGEVRKDL